MTVEGVIQIQKPISEAGRWVFWSAIPLGHSTCCDIIGLVGLGLDLFFGERVAGFSGFHLKDRANHEQDTRTP